MERFYFYSAMLSILLSILVFLSSLVFSFLERKSCTQAKRNTLLMASYVFFVFPVSLFFCLVQEGEVSVVKSVLMASLIMLPAFLIYYLLNLFFRYLGLDKQQKIIANKQSLLSIVKFLIFLVSPIIIFFEFVFGFKFFETEDDMNSTSQLRDEDYFDSNNKINPANGLPMINDVLDMQGNYFGTDNYSNDVITTSQFKDKDYFDSTNKINPANGLPMINDVLDVQGNCFGTDNYSNEDF